MAIQIASNQAQLAVDVSGAIPNSTLDPARGFLFGHLTTGWNGSNWVGDPVTCTASVPISGPQIEVDRAELGFVQIARASSFKAFYGGRVPSEGGIGLDYFVPPALTTRVILDSTKSARPPWYRNPKFIVGAGGRRGAEFGDHPGMRVRLSLENRARSNVRNFLFHCFMDREFFTVLTALQPAGKPQYIAYFQWRVRYEFKLTWQNGRPQIARNLSTSSLLVKGQTSGRPPDADIQSMLDNPSGEPANLVSDRAEAATVSGAPPNRSDNKVRFPAIGDDFWT